MSPDRDSERPENEEPEIDEYEVDGDRSIFSVLWFRALLVVLVIGVIAAIAVPYVRDATTSRAKTESASVTAASPPPAAVTPPAPVPAGATPFPVVTAAPSPVAATPPAAAAVPPPSKPAAARMTKTFEASTEAVKEAPKETSKGAEASATSKTAAKLSSSAAAPGPYWVQIGAFKDPDTAKRLAARLREQGFRVEQSSTVAGRGASATVPSDSSSDRFNVVVLSASAAEVSAKVAGKGMTAESTAGGAVVQPSLPLRQAINLSRDLSEAGLNVQVRRVAGPAPRADAGGSGTTLHRVRVAGFADRDAALAALKELQAKGFTPFVGRGNP